MSGGELDAFLSKWRSELAGSTLESSALRVSVGEEARASGLNSPHEPNYAANQETTDKRLTPDPEAEGDGVKLEEEEDSELWSDASASTRSRKRMPRREPSPLLVLPPPPALVTTSGCVYVSERMAGGEGSAATSCTAKDRAGGIKGEGQGQGRIEEWPDDVAATAKKKTQKRRRRCARDDETADADELVRPSRRGSSGRSLVDALIADLDEINTVPFFDVRLPREVALLIFSHLDAADLCRCACVSGSWRVLADDNHLWREVWRAATELRDLHQSVQPDQVQCLRWKDVVRAAVLHKRRVVQNWKERMCGLTDHQPSDVGVLCCVSYCQNKVLLCYSLGGVYIWNITEQIGAMQLLREQPFPQYPPPPPPPPPLYPGAANGNLPCCCSLSNKWAAVGTQRGNLKIYDLETASMVHSFAELGHITSLSIASNEYSVAVAIGSHTLHHLPTFPHSRAHSEIVVLVSDQGRDWSKRHLLVGSGEPSSDHKVTRISLLHNLPPPHPPNYHLLYSTRSSLTRHTVGQPPSSVVNYISPVGSMGGITCVHGFDFTADVVACAYGYQVQLFDLSSATHQVSLHGHTQPVISMDLHSSPPNLLVTGSADKKVMVFDCRTGSSVMKLQGHRGGVSTVQMDRWKVVSGSTDGTVIVWDQRMRGELWQTHERHPVEMCRFDGNYLTAAHVPREKAPLDYSGTSPSVYHRRQRGLVRVFDFSVDPLHYTRLLPSICSSAYDEPSASFYNLDLIVPYDSFVT